MKKSLVFLIVIMFCLSGYAQRKEFKNEIYIGLKGGKSFSKVRFYPFVETDFLSGNTAGLLFRMISEPHIGFQVEFNYVQKGWGEKSAGIASQAKRVAAGYRVASDRSSSDK